MIFIYINNKKMNEFTLYSIVLYSTLCLLIFVLSVLLYKQVEKCEHYKKCYDVALKKNADIWRIFTTTDEIMFNENRKLSEGFCFGIIVAELDSDFTHNTENYEVLFLHKPNEHDKVSTHRYYYYDCMGSEIPFSAIKKWAIIKK